MNTLLIQPTPMDGSWCLWRSLFSHSAWGPKYKRIKYFVFYLTYPPSNFAQLPLVNTDKRSKQIVPRTTFSPVKLWVKHIWQIALQPLFYVMCMTYWGGVTHTCLSKISHHWLRECSVPSHYPNQYQLIVNRTFANKFHWNFSQNAIICIQ